MSTPTVSSGIDLFAGTYGSTLPDAGEGLAGSAMVGLSSWFAPAVKGDRGLAGRRSAGAAANRWPAAAPGCSQRAASWRQNRPPTHAEISKNMNASAFSCGDSSASGPQLSGYFRGTV